MGSHVEAVSLVLAVFFGGLALGVAAFGLLADRVRRPLALYAGLEAGAGLLALVALALLEPEGPIARARTGTALLASATLLPPTFLLGGTLPALVRSVARPALELARAAGWILGANTLGSVAGVAIALALLPRLGLRATLAAAGGAALGIGAAAALCARRVAAPPPANAVPGDQRPPARPVVLGAAALAGAVTLGFEVLVARGAALRLGSSLLAWGAVLALVLLGLAAGNLATARRAARTPAPDTELGALEALLALAVAASPLLLLPPLGVPAEGLSPASVSRVALAVLPPALLMGGAFPYLVRLAVERVDRLGAGFGRVSAVNTVGGIAGALLVPFVLLAHLGLRDAFLACAVASGALGAAFLARGAPTGAARWLRPVPALGALALLAAAVQGAGRAPAGALRVIHVEDGAQASVVVVHTGAGRDLLVDGDPEASTAGAARQTEELLAALPLLLHPAPRRFLELGLGSGITLASAARFPLARLECVEIAPAVLRAARLFAPENGPVATGADPRLRLRRGDARVFLRDERAAWDVVVANTLHPWSVGATGLYSREYFARMAGALAPGGMAAQWVPLERIGAEALAAILRTFFVVFRAGGVFWATRDLVLIGSAGPLPQLRALAPPRRPSTEPLLRRLRLESADELRERWLGSAEDVRAVTGSGPLLTDDRPVLELAGALADRSERHTALGLVERVAAHAAASDPQPALTHLWLQSELARARGDASRAERLETLALEAGLGLARSSRAGRLAAEGHLELAAGRFERARSRFEGALALEPDDRDAWLGRAAIALGADRLEEARAALERLVELHPGDSPAWNGLGSLHAAAGRRAEAAEAFERALAADPYFPDALLRAAQSALERGDDTAARGFLERLRELSPLGEPPEAARLRSRLR